MTPRGHNRRELDRHQSEPHRQTTALKRPISRGPLANTSNMFARGPSCAFGVTAKGESVGSCIRWATVVNPRISGGIRFDEKNCPKEALQLCEGNSRRGRGLSEPIAGYRFGLPENPNEIWLLPLSVTAEVECLRMLGSAVSSLRSLKVSIRAGWPPHTPFQETFRVGNLSWGKVSGRGGQIGFELSRPVAQIASLMNFTESGSIVVEQSAG